MCDSWILLLINNRLKEHCFDLESFFEENVCYIILNYNLSDKRIIRRQCKVLLDEILLQKDIFENLECTIGLGTVEDDVNTIDGSFKTAVRSYEQRLIAGTNRVIDYDFTDTNQLADSQLFYDFNKEMDGALERLDKAGVVSALRFLRDGIKSRPQTSGEIMGLIPINSQGQSWLFRLLCQNYPIDYGRIYIDNQLVNYYEHSNNNRNRVYIIEKQSKLIQDLTVSDNIFVLKRGFRKYIIERFSINR